MGACVSVKCPECKKEFVADPLMLGKNLDFHCPFCDKYFKEEEALEIKK